MFIAECLAADVRITRRRGETKWRLAAIVDVDRCISWETKFPTDEAAWEHFISVVEKYGMETVAGSMAVAIEKI
jgi:hypothetical protein